MNPNILMLAVAINAAVISGAATQGASPAKGTAPVASAPAKTYLSQPLVSSIYTADPSAHVFKGRIYVYPSHDIEGPSLPDVAPFKGSQGGGFKMRDYRVLSMDRVGAPVTVHPVALDIKDVPWAARQMWAPDAAYKAGTYFLYFPAKDRAGAFRIGVATSRSPTGPFKARAKPIAGSYSIDPSVFTDDGGASYMYFGGLSGGQLQQTVSGVYDPAGPIRSERKPDEPAYGPAVARMRGDMIEYAEAPRSVSILDTAGKPLLAGDADKTFFEASWMHKFKGIYYLSYSTGGTHFIAYATGTSPYGPFTHRGNVLLPVEGWTTHHSIVEHDGRWWLFYADSQLSGKTALRNVKVTELFHEANGDIRTIDPMMAR